MGDTLLFLILPGTEKIRYGRIRILSDKNRMPRFHRPARAGKKRRSRRDLSGRSGPDRARTRSHAVKSAAPAQTAREIRPARRALAPPALPTAPGLSVAAP